MSKCKIQYFNYDKRLHKEFPEVCFSKVSNDNGIINVNIECDKVINDIEDDIGYDTTGKYLMITIGQWHHCETGKYITIEDFFNLDEIEAYQYEHVSSVLKIPVDNDYRACYHNFMDKRVKISFIPYKMLTNPGKTIFEYRV